MKLNRFKKGASELVSIIIAIAILGSLSVGIIIFIGNKVVDNQGNTLNPTVDVAISAIQS